MSKSNFSSLIEYLFDQEDDKPFLLVSHPSNDDFLKYNDLFDSVLINTNDLDLFSKVMKDESLKNVTIIHTKSDDNINNILNTFNECNVLYMLSNGNKNVLSDSIHIDNTSKTISIDDNNSLLFNSDPSLINLCLSHSYVDLNNHTWIKDGNSFVNQDNKNKCLILGCLENMKVQVCKFDDVHILFKIDNHGHLVWSNGTLWKCNTLVNKTFLDVSNHEWKFDNNHITNTNNNRSLSYHFDNVENTIKLNSDGTLILGKFIDDKIEWSNKTIWNEKK